jgi:hypothetical protein
MNQVLRFEGNTVTVRVARGTVFDVECRGTPNGGVICAAVTQPFGSDRMAERPEDAEVAAAKTIALGVARATINASRRQRDEEALAMARERGDDSLSDDELPADLRRELEERGLRDG